MRLGQVGRVVAGVVILGGLALLSGAGFGKDAGVAQIQTPRNPDVTLPPGSSQPSSVLPSDDPGMLSLPAGPMRDRMNEDRLNALNKARHKRLEDDADKLMALSNELKTEVDKTNKDELSLEVMRKASEIEKLAHDVQSQMKN